MFVTLIQIMILQRISMPLDYGQIGLVGIDHENGKERRRFGATRISADFVMCARLFRPALARIEDLHLAAVDLAADRSG